MNESFLKIKDGKINFSCTQSFCKHSCCGPYSSISESLGNIDKRPFDEIVLTNEDYKRIYDAGFADHIEDGYSQEMKKTYHKMALESDGTCKAFINGKCAIQSIKPTLCTAFPFYFDMFSGLCAIKCEGFNDKYWTDIENLKPCFDAAKKMYEFWIEFYTEQHKDNKQ